MAKCQLEIMATKYVITLIEDISRGTQTHSMEKERSTHDHQNAYSVTTSLSRTNCTRYIFSRIIHSRDVEFNDRTPAAPFVEPGTSNDISASDIHLLVVQETGGNRDVHDAHRIHRPSSY